MRVFVAGASGVIGVRLVPLLVARGHTVAGMTRREANAERLRCLGAVAVVCDVFEAPALTEAVSAFAPEVVVHQLTNLPDDPRLTPQFAAENARMRREGTRNLLAAAGAAGAKRFLAQSVAWSLSGDGAEAVRELEGAVLAVGGTVLRYGRSTARGRITRRRRRRRHGSTSTRPPVGRLMLSRPLPGSWRSSRTLIPRPTSPTLVDLTDGRRRAASLGDRMHRRLGGVPAHEPVTVDRRRREGPRLRLAAGPRSTAPRSPPEQAAKRVPAVMPVSPGPSLSSVPRRAHPTRRSELQSD